MQQYLQLVRHVLDHGTQKNDRTGTGTLSVFGYQMRFDLAAGFPLLTTKKLHLRSIIHELLGFLAGETHARYLNEKQVTNWGRRGDAAGERGREGGAGAGGRLSVALVACGGRAAHRSDHERDRGDQTQPRLATPGRE